MTHSHILYKINIRRVMYLNVGDKATSKKNQKTKNKTTQEKYSGSKPKKSFLGLCT